MALLRIKIELNKGRRGVPLNKLGDISKETEKFFKMLSQDLGIADNTGRWLAVEFQEGSLAFTNEYTKPQSEGMIHDYNDHFERIAKCRDPHERGLEKVGIETLKQFAKIADPIDPDELISFGLFKNEHKKPHWLPLSKQHAEDILEKIEEVIDYHGALQGKLYGLTKGSPKYWFDLRDMASNALIKCYFEKEHYQKVVSALKDEDAIINVSGMIRTDRAKRKIEWLRVEKIEETAPFKDTDIDAFLGCAPNITGDMTTDQFIDSIRDNGD